MRSVRRVSWLVLFAFVALPVWAMPGGEGGGEREAIERAMQRVHDLIAKAEQCEKAGDIAAAAQCRDEAAGLKREIAAAKERLGRREEEQRAKGKGEPKGGDADLHAIMNGLEQGIHALKRAGWEEEANRLTKIAKEIHQQRSGAREKGEEARRAKEGDEVRRQFEILRLAMKGCLEAGREKEADRIEHAAHVLKLNAEGRRDPEAEEIRRNAPNREQMAELLAFSARCLREQGRPDASDMVANLARSYAGKPAGGAEKPHPMSRKGEAHHGEAREELLARIDRLEAMVRELEAAMREMHRGESGDR